MAIGIDNDLQSAKAPSFAANKLSTMDKSTRFWDRVADGSGEGLGATSQKTVNLTLPFLKTQDVVLDFGCGAGNLSNAIAKHVQQLDGIDTSGGMITSAQALAAKQKLQNVHFAQLDIFNTGLQPAYYDAVLAFSVLQYIEDLAGIASRIKSLLKPNGYFISTTPCLGEGLHPLRPLMFIMTKIGIVPKMQFYTLSKLQAAIKSKGFSLVATEKLSTLPEYLLVMKWDR